MTRCVSNGVVNRVLLLSIMVGLPGVHPVRIIYRAYTQKVFSDLRQRVPADFHLLLLVVVVQNAKSFRCAIPSMDAATMALTRQLETITRPRREINCEDLYRHGFMNQNRYVHHIDFNYFRDDASSLYRYKDDVAYFTSMSLPALTMRTVQCLFDGNIINVDRNKFG